jgi:hypothetical protein
MHVLEFMTKVGLEFVIPAGCFSSYRWRLFASSCWPIAVLIIACSGLIGRELVRLRSISVISCRAAVDAGLQGTLPLTLFLTFLLVPSVSTRIFKTFSCDPIEFDPSASDPDQVTRRYLHDDLSLSCDSGEYLAARDTALFMLFVWPVGIPVLYSVVLWESRGALLSGSPTRLSRATAFLSADYEVHAFWWEPLEMCRKLTLTGWLLLIDGKAELVRVLVAIVVSMAFFGIDLTVKPLRRPEDRALMSLSEMFLILIYACVLVIKTCSLSADICSHYGFGSSASGIFIFFLFFGLSTLLFQLFWQVAALVAISSSFRR